MLILTLNAGSSSIKFSAFDSDGLSALARGEISAVGPKAKLTFKAEGAADVERGLGNGEGGDPDAALDLALQMAAQAFPGREVGAVGHRIVHGGMKFDRPARLDDAAMKQVKALAALAPLHQPANIAGIGAARAAFPNAEQIGCFDTAFHRGHDFFVDAYGLPRALYDEGVRRYGFHGLSCEFIAARLAEIAPDVANGRVIIAHLGAGASMTALREGRSVATTMGFSALDGLVMATRPGHLDPGVMLYLMSEKKLDADALSNLLYKKSGLAGLSGLSGDWRELETAQTPEAEQAIDCFVHRIRYELGGLAATLGGLDALVFTGGIGEHSAELRERAVAGMDWLGLKLDPAANRAHAERIDAGGVRVFALATDEEKRIAELTARTVFRTDGASSR